MLTVRGPSYRPDSIRSGVASPEDVRALGAADCFSVCGRSLDCSAAHADAWGLLHGGINMCDVEIRNPKHEIRNKFKCPDSNEPQARLSSFRILIFGFVSDFGFRIFIFGLLFLGTWCEPAC